MLILARRRGQRILIGDEIVIEVASLGGEQVRLAISAPSRLRVDRQEVRDRIDRDGPDRPDPAAELDRLRDRLAEVEAERDEYLALLSRPGRRRNEDGEIL